MRFENIDKFTLYRTLVIVVSVSLILWGCLVILQPFIPAFLLAIIFALSTWPAYVWLTEKLNGRRTLAACLMTLTIAVCFLVPMVFLGSSLAENFGHLYSGMIEPVLNNPGNVPSWLRELPLIGPHIDSIWDNFVTSGANEGASARDYIAPKLIAVGAAVGRGVLDLALGVLITFFFFRHGISAAERINSLIERFVGPRGRHLLGISKRTAIGVVYGVLGTALAQGALAGLGFWFAGVPGAPFLGLVTLLLSLVPMGPPLIWAPAAIWLFTNGLTNAGIFLALYGLIIISGVDNIIRPYFISLGSSLPLPLVLLGVFGGLLAFGFIGLFIGPTLLAVAYALVMEWSHSDKPVAE
ncbi:MAG: AI-2E family transporter [Alphaproteobacteria bacterium]|nr:AI-2E family transporter [Alphaproteobacteria bacterium]